MQYADIYCVQLYVLSGVGVTAIIQAQRLSELAREALAAWPPMHADLPGGCAVQADANSSTSPTYLLNVGDMCYAGARARPYSPSYCPMSHIMNLM